MYTPNHNAQSRPYTFQNTFQNCRTSISEYGAVNNILLETKRFMVGNRGFEPDAVPEIPEKSKDVIRVAETQLAGSLDDQQNQSRISAQFGFRLVYNIGLSNPLNLICAFA